MITYLTLQWRCCFAFFFFPPPSADVKTWLASVSLDQRWLVSLSGFNSCLCCRLDGKHVVFGTVIEGDNVVKKMEGLGSQSGKTNRKVYIADCGQLWALHPFSPCPVVTPVMGPHHQFNIPIDGDWPDTTPCSVLMLKLCCCIRDFASWSFFCIDVFSTKSWRLLFFFFFL